MAFFKSAVLRDDVGRLDTLADRQKVAVSVGEKTFKRSDFTVIDILGRFSYGYVAVYRFERSTDSVCVGSQVKRM